MHFAFCLYKHFPYSGLSLDMLRIADECISRGHKVTIFCGCWEGPVTKGIDVVHVKHLGLTNHGSAYAFHRKLKKHLKAHSFDAVVGFNKMPGLDFYYCGDFCFIGRSRLKHSFFYRFTPRFLCFSLFEKSVFSVESKTKILSLSQREESIYQQYYLTPDERFLEVPPTLVKEKWEDLSCLPEREQVRQSLGVINDQKMILLVGSGFKTKGLDRVEMIYLN